VRRVLPPALADALLRKLLADGDWHRGTWTVGGKTSVNARRTRSFRIRMTGGGEFEALGGGADAQAREENGSSRARGYAACPELLEAARFVTAAAREVAPRSWKDNWEPTVAFGNRYDGGQEHVGYHSDFLMTMGPRPIIAGLSLGATREFRLRREATDYAPSRVVCMPAEHNSLIVMSRDCQEEWSAPGVLRRACTRELSPTIPAQEAFRREDVVCSVSRRRWRDAVQLNVPSQPPRVLSVGDSQLQLRQAGGIEVRQGPLLLHVLHGRRRRVAEV